MQGDDAPPLRKIDATGNQRCINKLTFTSNDLMSTTRSTKTGIFPLSSFQVFNIINKGQLIRGPQFVAVIPRWASHWASTLHQL